MEALLVTERIFGPLGAAIQASVFIVLAAHPDLRAEQDRLDAAEAALDDGVEPDDPRVEELAVQRCAHQMTLDRAEEELFEIYDASGAASPAVAAMPRLP